MIVERGVMVGSVVVRCGFRGGRSRWQCQVVQWRWFARMERKANCERREEVRHAYSGS